MGNNTGAEPPSSEATPSQPGFLNESKLPGHLFRIQARQRELLAAPNSWAQFASRGPKPGVNLPPEVLENLRSFHRRRQEAAISSQEPTDEGQSNDASVDHQPEAELDSDLQGGNPATSQVSWSPTPTPSPRRPQAQTQERFASQSPVPEEDAEPDEVYSQTLPEAYSQTLPEQPFVTQVPAESPPPTTSDIRSAQKRPAFTDFPSSSLGIEEPLEIVAPGAVTEQAPPVNKSADLDPTPPSAQVQVPCTFEPDSSISEPREKQAGKRPYVELASLQTVQRRIANSKQKAAAVVRTAFAQKIGGYATGIEDSQSSDGSVSSVIPATNTIRPNYSPVKSPTLFPVISTVKETPYIPRRPSIQSRAGSPPAQLRGSPLAFEPESPRRLSPEYRPASPELPFPSPEIRRVPETHLPSSPHRPHFTTTHSSNPQSQAPFIRYCLSYPNYTGSLGDFVRACIYIKILQRKRALASYQYDDFVRAWVQGYIPYIEKLGESDKPLTAIEWYMDMVDEADYIERIITKDNLESTLDFYGDEVKSARQSLSIPTTQSSADVALSPPKEVAEPKEIAQPKEMAPPREVTRRPPEPINLGSTMKGGPGLVQEARKPLQRARSVQEQLDFQQPELLLPDDQLDEVTPGPSVVVPPESDKEQRVVSVSSTPASLKAPRKRPSDDDDAGQPSPKRALVEPLVPSENNSRVPRVATPSSASGVRRGSTSSTAEPKKTAQNLEKQAMHWKKYLAKRKAQRMSDSISVASSAPPRSAQE
jgi:hypothetical protein